MKLKYLCLGKDCTKTKNGYSGKGGGWDLYKMFYEEDGEYGEFFFNLNPKTSDAEITWKDEEYADVLVKAFGKAMKHS